MQKMICTIHIGTASGLSFGAGRCCGCATSTSAAQYQQRASGRDDQNALKNFTSWEKAWWIILPWPVAFWCCTGSCGKMVRPAVPWRGSACSASVLKCACSFQSSEHAVYTCKTAPMMFGRTPQSHQTAFICIALALFPTNKEKSESAGKWQFKKCRAYMGVSKNRGGPPKWMVNKNGKPY